VLPTFVNTMKVSGVQTHTHTHTEKKAFQMFFTERESH